MKFYKNGNYFVCIMNDGTKIRKTNGDTLNPSFAESYDVTITHKCKVGCPFCYAGCTENGRHADLFKYRFIDTLHPYTEVAFNGNDMDHPQLKQFLKLLKDKKVFANMTVNQNQFMENYEYIKQLTDNKLIHGLGISFNDYDMDFIEKAKGFENAVIHVINGIVKLSELKKIKDEGLKILILGYKDIRRGDAYIRKNQAKIRANKYYLYNKLPHIIKDGWFKVVSFDNLAIKQLDAKRLMTNDEWNEFYMGDDGNFSFYIDMVSGRFAKNSCTLAKMEIGEKSVDEMFEIIKNENK